ncbi:FecR family protein [Fluviicoccus keumensis]|uniref:FecR family protein n=1 Tax=Fluviicoccus keumensis TaxID=1435465 RepID=A0A4Q7YJ63_9GAMM|nr:FecR family protein [Fluviicoccus keumensis]RZU36813.1 FecR family protein [Fluviicoccus keumensis]
MQGQTRLHASPTLLAFLIAAACAGQASADVAGRVNFATGPVKAIALDGTQRTLTRGDFVNSGERLETGRGRLQIRFTDGSFLSLQPNTIFRLDSYRFQKDKPNEGSLLFNFVQGGMRTITGAIGHINRAQYKVRTPVASLGIRGTGYASTYTQGTLTLSVDKGIVNVSNDFGSSNVNAGQTFQVVQGEAPRLAPAGVSAEARALPPARDAAPAAGAEIADTPGLNSDAGIVAGNNQDFGQLVLDNVLPDSVYPPQSGAPLPSYTVGTRFVQADGSLLVSGLGAYFNSTDTAPMHGGLVRLMQTAGPVVTTLFSVGTLQFNNVTTLGALSYGEWTNGTAAVGKLDPSDNAIVLGANVFEPYIVGITAPQSLALDAAGNGTRLSYALAGGTVAGSSDGESGVLKSLTVNVTLAPVTLVDVDMTIGMANTGDYVASGHGIRVNTSGQSTTNGFQLTGSDLLATGQNCTTGCAVRFSAFYAGTDPQLGAVYIINRPNAQISGVAALDLTGKTAVSQLLPDAASPTYRAVFAKGGSPTAANAISADFDAGGKWLSGTTANGSYGPSGTSAAASQDVVHAASTLSWGQWVNGDAMLGGSVPVSLNSQGVHYLVGSPTASGQLPTTVLTYQLVGGTHPSLADASGSPVSAGALTSGSLTLDYGLGKASLGLGMSFVSGGQASAVQLTGQNGSLSAGNINFNTLGVTVGVGSGSPVACTSCSGSASGFVAGSAGEMAGLGFGVSGVTLPGVSGGSITGVAGFGNPSTN